MQSLRRRIEALSASTEIAVVLALTVGLGALYTLLTLLAGAAGAPAPPPPAFTDALLIEGAISEILFGGAAALFLRLRGWPVIALVQPPTAAATVLGAGLAVASWLALAALETALLELGLASALDEIGARSRLSLAVVAPFALVNAAFEEILWLGYLVTALARSGPLFAIGFSAALRSFLHFYQGPTGALVTLALGLAWGWLFWRLRLVWPFILAHALIDLVALARWAG